MSSLRDQLLKAGFKEPPKPPGKSKRQQQEQKRRQAKKAHQQQNADAEAKIAQRKVIKGQIAALINSRKIKDTKGEVVHHYTVGSRIRQLFLNEALHKQLIDGEVVITRLNGQTCLIPTDSAKEILALNPEWAVFKSSDADTSDKDDDYGDFPVPDDLKW